MNPKTALRFLFALSFSFLGVAINAQTLTPATAPPKAAVNFGKLPLNFEPNRGQTSNEVQWLARGPESTLFLSGNDATIEINHLDKVKKDGGEMHEMHGVSLRMSLVNAQTAKSSLGENMQTGKANYFTGRDSAHWQKNVPLYGQVNLSEVYPGIDLLYHGERGQLEYDFRVAPNADASRIALSFAGATPKLAENGDLVLPVQGEPDVRFDKPVVYQEKNGIRTVVDSRYLVAGNGQVRFELGQYDHSRELVIDPKLVFVGTLGAGNYPYATKVSQITVDSTGAIYLIGTTNDPTYPVTSGAYQKVCGPATGSNASNGGVYCGTFGATSAYISKISADGTTLVYSTYLSGGGGYEQGTSIAVDSNGVAYLLGATASNNFPITSDALQTLCQPISNSVLGPPIPAPIAQCNNFSNGGGTEYTVNGPVFFYAKLSADGSSLIYSSFLGGSGAVYPIATALDSSGNWYLFGQSVVGLSSNIYTGPNGNGGAVQFPGISSNAYLAYSGVTSNNQPPTHENINVAAVLSKFSNDGKTLLYGTFFGDNVNGYDFNPTSLAVGANGLAFIGGWSSASQIPTTPNAVKGQCTALATPNSTCTTVDGYAVAFDTTKSGAASLVYSTRIGGAATSQGSNIPSQEVLGMAADGNNDLYVTGYTYDPTFPVPQNGFINTCGAINPNNPDPCNAAFALELNPTGTSILGGSYIIGSSTSNESSIGYKAAIDSRGRPYFYGLSYDAFNTFPLVNPVQAWQLSTELYIAAMSPDLTKMLFATRFGNPNLQGSNITAVNGLALDPNNSIYFAGSTFDATFPATPGTYTTAVNSGTEAHTFFGKISAVLPVGATSLTVTPTTTNAGQHIVFAVNVATAANTVAPTGSVAVSYTTPSNSTPTLFETLQLDGSGNATYTTTSLAAGTYIFTGAYSGDGNYDVSSSSAVTVTINTPPAMTVPTVTLTSSAPKASPGYSVVFTATVTGMGSTAPTGKVTFLDGTTVLGTGTVSNSVATYTTSSLSTGTHSITASYGGDSNYSTAVSAAFTETIVAASFTVTYAPNPVAIQRGSAGTTTMTITPSVPYIGTLTFGCNGTNISVTCSFNQSSLTWSASNSTGVQTSIITIQTTAPNASIRSAGLWTGSWLGSLIASFGLLLLARRRKLGPAVQLLTVVVLLVASTGVLAGLSGCGGGSNQNKSQMGGTPIGTQSLSITFNGNDNAAPLSITVQ